MEAVSRIAAGMPRERTDDRPDAAKQYQSEGGMPMATKQEVEITFRTNAAAYRRAVQDHWLDPTVCGGPSL